MRIRPKSDSQLPKGQVGEVIGFTLVDGVCLFRVAWYGRPGVTTVPAADVEVDR